MKRLILVFCALFLVAGLAGCSISMKGTDSLFGINTRKTLNGDKNIVEKETALKEMEYELIIEDVIFTAFTANKPNASITISENNTGKVTLATDKNILDTITVEVTDNEILIKGDSSLKYDISDFDLRIGAKVNAFTINGGFNLVLDVPSVTKFDGVVNGAVDGNMAFGTLDSFSLEINGACDLSISGEADSSSIEINGAGDVKAFDLRTQNSVVTVNGAGSCQVYASETLNAALSGVGTIVYDGNPRTTNNSSGIGSIKKR